MAIKISAGKLVLSVPMETLVRVAFDEIGIQQLILRPEHLYPLVSLPLHHRDPFDRLLAVQCRVEGLSIVSADTVFDAYGLNRVW